MDSLILLELAALGVLFLLSAVFAASETSLLSLGRIRLAHAIEQGGKRGKALEAWRSDPNRLLTTLLILNNATNITASTIAAFLAFRLSEEWSLNRAQVGALVAGLVTAVIIVFGEVAPKLLAIQRSEAIALAVIRPVIWVDRVMNPIGRLVVGMANFFLRLLGQKPSTHVPIVTEEEIQTLIKMGADAGVIEDTEHKMLHGVMRFSDTEVREVMVNRLNMECIDATDSMDHIINKIIQTGYSRMPVFRDSVDNIVGVVYTKDIISILQNSELIVLQDILRQPYFVPETKKVDELLREFQKGHIHIAIVVDEYGGTAGLVTIEDLLEVIVGDIRDEYDVEEKAIEKTGDNAWTANGQADIDEVGAALGVQLPHLKDMNTVGGLLSDLLGHLPRKGEQARYENVHFTVLAASTRKVERIALRVLPPTPGVSGEGI